MTDSDTNLQPWRTIAPTAFLQFDAIAATAERSVPRALFDALERLIAVLLRIPGLSRPNDTPKNGGEAMTSALNFAEQFVIDVASMTDELRNAMYSEMGTETLVFVQTVYVADVFTRARIGLAKVFGTPYIPSLVPEDSVDAAQLWAQIESFMTTVAKLRSLDPLTTELVRLQGARVHDCRLCRSRLSVRALDAAEAAGSASVFDGLDDLETAPMSERARTAVRLADALVTQPSLIDTEFAASARALLTDAEITEIVLDVVRNAANKIAVAFGADAPVVTEGVEYFDIGADGEMVVDTDQQRVRAATE